MKNREKNIKIKDMEIYPNPGKKLVVEIEGKKYARYPVKTHFIEASDKLEKIIEKYVLPNARKNDIVVLCQKIVSILQGRVVYKEDVKVGFWADFLSRFAKKTPCGFSVGNPLKMQIAINLAGLPRILLASFFSALTKVFGISGVFYRVAGHQINQLDGFYGEAFSQYGKIGILGPKNCDKSCQQLKDKYGISFLMADINDIGGNIIGRSQELKGREALFLKILKDNPAGQSNQQTPIIIIREIDV